MGRPEHSYHAPSRFDSMISVLPFGSSVGRAATSLQPTPMKAAPDKVLPSHP